MFLIIGRYAVYHEREIKYSQFLETYFLELENKALTNNMKSFEN